MFDHYTINLDLTMKVMGSPLRFKSGNSHDQMGDTDGNSGNKIKYGSERARPFMGPLQ